MKYVSLVHAHAPPRLHATAQVRPDEMLQLLHAIPLVGPTGVQHRPGFRLPSKSVRARAAAGW